MIKNIKRIQAQALWCFALVSLSFAFLSVFSYYTSPFCIIEGYDASFFRLVGMGMTKGYLPYRDFFDMKGPYLFFIQYFGQIISYGRNGLFLIQTVSLAVCLYFTDKIIWFYNKRVSYLVRICVLVPFLCFLADTFCGGNITEEFSLPLLMICMYMAVKYCSTMQEQPHPPIWAGVYGFCFGILTMIRITNAVTICVIVGFVTVYLLIQKRFYNLLLNAISFIVGFVISVIPAILYCVKHGILLEMIDQVFLFGYTYAAEGGLIKLFFFDSECVWYTPFLIYPLIMLVYTKKHDLMRYLSVLHAAALTVVLSMGNSYPHYFVLMLPYLAYGTALLMHAFEEQKCRRCVLAVSLIITACLIPLMLKSINKLAPFVRRFTYSSREYYEHYTDTQAQEIAAFIPEDERDSVFTYGFYSEWYVETGLFPCIRYCDWQNHYIELSPEVREDLQNILQNSPPKWIVTSLDTEEWNPEFLNDVLDNAYTLHAQNDRYHLWRLQ